MQAIKIADITLSNNVILAPLSGVTDKPFRETVNKFGAGLLVSEMIASKAMILETKKSFKKMELAHSETCTAVQLAGNEPDIMAEAAKISQDTGARIIDMNFGCRVKKVVKGYAGSFLMKDLELSHKIIKSVVDAVDIPVTIKMRMGWDSQSLNAPELAKIAEDCGVSMITVHGRTRCQMYKGNADWKFIKQVKDSVNIPVIANGDICNIHDIKQCLEESQADGVMIGRATYGKPWLISQMIEFLHNGNIQDDPSKEIKIATILDHFDRIIEHYGEENGVRMARKHLSWYSGGIEGSANFRNQINKITKSKDAKFMIEEFFNNNMVI